MSKYFDKVEKAYNKEFEHNESCTPRGDQNSPPWMPCNHDYKTKEDIKDFFRQAFIAYAKEEASAIRKEYREELKVSLPKRRTYRPSSSGIEGLRVAGYNMADAAFNDCLDEVLKVLDEN